MTYLSRVFSGATALVLLTSAGPSFAARDTFVYDIVAGWTVHTDRARDFACFMEAEFDGGSVLQAGYDDSSGGLYMAVADPAWGSITDGESYDVEIVFGEQSAWSGNATGISLENEANQQGLRFDVEDGPADAFMQQLMGEYSVSVARGGGDPVTLSLDGSYAAALRLDECQQEMVEENAEPE